MTTTNFSVPAGDFFPATLEFVDAFGNIGQAPAGFVPVWTSANTEIISLTVSADGLSANCVTLGPAGNCDIAVVDATTGANLTGDLFVTVTAGPVAQLTVVPGQAQV